MVSRTKVWVGPQHCTKDWIALPPVEGGPKSGSNGLYYTVLELLEAGANMCPTVFQTVISPEPNVGLTSNQAVNSS